MLLLHFMFLFIHCRIRGAQRIIFYSPPPHAVFYSEMLNALEDCGYVNVTISSQVVIYIIAL